jgi:hypothetical protein
LRLHVEEEPNYERYADGGEPAEDDRGFERTGATVLVLGLAAEKF